jgi:cysteine dioxygenase
VKASVLANGQRGQGLGVPLRRLIEGLGRFRGRIPQKELVRQVRALDVSARDVADFSVFHDLHYARNLIHRAAHVEVLCLCWHSGQRSPIHDHDHSNCVVRVLEGVMTNTDYELLPSGYLRPTASHDYDVGGMEARAEADIHQVANLQPAGCDLVTLHVYSPPLARMNVFAVDRPNVSGHSYPVDYWFQGDGI